MNISMGYLIRKSFVFIVLLTLFNVQYVLFAQDEVEDDILSVSDRTGAVRDAIVAAVDGVNSAADVTEAHLAAITQLNLRNKNISELSSGDFSGMSGLVDLNLYNNNLSSLPHGIFEGLTALNTLRLGRNAVDPFPLTVTLQKVEGNQFRAVAPAGAIFDYVVPVSVSNGTIGDVVTTLTIAKGSTESEPVTITRTDGTTEAVTANIGILPSLPRNHYGYTLTKADTLPLTVMDAEPITPIETPAQPPETPVQIPEVPMEEGSAPVFTDGTTTVRAIAENTDENMNIGTPITATDADNDTLTYTLNGVDASSFNIDTTTGQLKTKLALDYEMKRVYIVSITVSDGEQTDTISVIISVIDVAETTLTSAVIPVSDRTPEVRDAIIAAVPDITTAENITNTHLAEVTTLNLRNAGISELKSGDFSGLSGLTSLNLYNNMLSSLPTGVFEGLTSLSSLRLGGNVVDPILIIVSLQQVGTDEYRVVIPTGAPFDVVVLVDGMTVTVPKGSMNSSNFSTSAQVVNIGVLPAVPLNHFGYVLSKSMLCNRTSQVADAIVEAVPNVTDCRNINDIQLAAITHLNLNGKGVTSLNSDDFVGMLSLTMIDLRNNQLNVLPNGIFSKLPALTTLHLGGNSVYPFPLGISLEKIGTNQIQARIPSAAPYDISLPIIVKVEDATNSTITLTISKGGVESQTVTVDRPAGTTAAVSVAFDTFPAKPELHTGYTLTNTGDAQIQVFEALNSAPVFIDGTNVERSIPENTNPGVIIGAPITATDVDEDTLTYTLSGTDAESFDVDSNSGQLKTKAALDYETKNAYTVTLTASDGTLSDTVTFMIQVSDVNEAPTFSDGDSVTREIAENTGSGENIGAPITATDVDDDTLTYSLGGTDAESFGIDSNSGQLKTKGALDHEIKNAYTVTLTASDGTLSDTITVMIQVSDVNEAPMFNDGDSVTREIAENTGSGENIGAPITATDVDEDTLTYTLSGTDAESFDVDSNSGQLKTKAALDYETKNAYTVTLTAFDGNLTDTISVTLNITDAEDGNNPPTFTEGSTATRTVPENTTLDVDIGSPVSASDADNDTLTYTLGGTDASSFSIDSTTGQLRTNAPLDYETKSIYTVTIDVSDGTDTATITATINVSNVTENSAPIFTDGTNVIRSIAENTGSGVDIGTPVSASDADNDTLTYTLSGTDAASFSINSTTGQLRTNAPLDYESDTSYTVTITVADGKGGTDTISVTINITDVDETPSNNAPVFSEGSSTSRSVQENASSGVDVGSDVSATDDDGDELSYSLSGTDASSFSINNSTGQLITITTLNYETKDSYSVTITASDGSLTSSIDVTIDIIDVNDAPVYTTGSSTSRIVAEDAAIGTDIGTPVTATDEDGDNLSYSLSGTDAASFSIDNTSGQLNTAITFNAATKTEYSVIVTASDGNLSDTITVTINIRSVNDAPVFTEGTSATRSITENTATNINIGAAVSATDADNDTLTYTLGGTDAAAFDITATSGQLRTSAALNFETKETYSVTITASDGNLTDSITVTINITDVNDVPVFTDGANTTRSIAENTDAGINIGTAITATDEDEDTLTYTLGGTDADAFDIIATNGQLQTKDVLDFEEKDEYTVTIAVADGNGGTDSIGVTINVTDLDELPANNPPVFTDGTSTTRSIAENSAADVNIGAPIAATDADNNTLAYTLSGTDAASFAIESTTGQLKTNAALDHEVKEEYSVNVNVNDGSTSVSISVTINVTDVNDAPEFAGTSANRSIAENTATAQDIGTAIAATDQDGDTLTYTLGGTDVGSFSIVSTSGQLQTSAALDYETKTSYSVTVSVSDSNGGTDSIDVTITITDANDAPIFSEGDTATRSIAENTASGQNIGSAVTATDPDTEDTLTYSLGGTDAASFDIVSTSGQLQTSAALDYETKTSYSVTVSVSDGNDGTDSIDVTINVTDINENRAPVFTDGDSTTRSVAENTDSGENIGAPVAATDPNTNDTLTYTLGGTDASSFSIVSSSGQLQTSAALDYETKTSYSVTVSVSDGNGGTDSIAVTINVTDVNENSAPTFTEGTSTTRTVAEDTGSGVDIGSPVGATDPDNDTLTYTLGGTDVSSFSINSTNGQLRTSASLDYETKISYSVTVSVSDGKGGTNSITVTITVTDVNEGPNNDPIFTEGDTATRSVAEGTEADQNIGTPVAATDTDVGNRITYTLSGTDASSFTIVSTSGQLKTIAALDYETKSSYSVTITAADQFTGSDTIAVTINVTDVDETGNDPPTFSEGSSTTRSVEENTASGQSIGTAVTATDSDNDTLTYTLGGTDASSFSIISSSGQLQTNTALDYETTTSYSVTVSVSDSNGGTDSIDVTINVTDVDENNAPTFTEGDSTTRTVAEDTSSGVDIGSPVGATDPDNDTLTYTLGGTDVSSFSINSTNGQLRTSASLDYETKISYSVTVSVSDGKGGTNSITVTITVTDVNEGPNNDPIFTEGDTATRSVAEGTEADQNIGTPVAATDTDVGNRITYTLSGTDASSFTIVSTSGQLKTIAALDYETKSSYSVTITAADQFTGSDTIAVTINVTDVDETGNDPPTFSEGASTTRSVAENTASGQNIGTSITATDSDNDTLTYTLGGTDVSSFGIVSTSGQLQTSAALDYETKTSYSVTVSVSDSNGGTDSIDVTINVTDVNEPPVFADGTSTTRTVAENTASGQNIGTPVAATDVDTNDTLSYTLGGADASSFSIVSSSGQLQTSAALDYETKAAYSVTVSVSDGNGGTDSITVTITVTDVNEGPNNDPIFTEGDTATRSVAEGTEADQNIGTPVTATDEDAANIITYTLSGTDASSFTIVSTSGQLKTIAALDYETKSSYSVTITAADQFTGSDTIAVTINVTDVDETGNDPPTFSEGSSTTRSVAENTASGQSIGTSITATDSDNDTLTYTLGGTDVASFSIISASGQLQTNTALDYETTTSYSVTVSVSDSNGGTDSIDVTINVTDVNEPPVFADGTSTTRTVAEDTSSGVDIGSPVGATDPDNDTLTYTLGGTDVSSFSINSTNGQLRTSASLDYETKISYSVTVTADDGKGGTDSIDVTITVTDVNEGPNNDPMFTEGDTATRSVTEGTEADQNIGTPVAATDTDVGNRITYTLSGTDASSFTIVSTSGQLKTNAALDYETKTSYSVTITAADQFTGSDTIAVTINVTDVDETGNDPPTFSEGSSTTRSIAENTASGQNIGTPITATDSDNDTLTYTLGGTDASSFSIISSSGQLQTNTALDYETTTSYSVTVSVSDSNGGTDSIDVTINVTDVDENNAPTFTEGDSTTRTVAENTSSGVDIGSPVAATDSDNDTLTYTLGGTDASSFSIVSASGQLQTNTALDYETTTSYSVTVSVSDGNGGTDSITVTINVTDVVENVNSSPTFTDGDTTTRSIVEATASGAPIGSAVSATDTDTDDTLTYTLGGTDASSFSIDSTTGQLKTSATLSQATQSSYSVTVSVSDGNGGTDSITVTITVTVFTPVADRTEDLMYVILDKIGAKDPEEATLTLLATITELDLSGETISTLQAGDFDGLSALTSLEIQDDGLSDISPIAHLTSLTYLDLNRNSISDISPLRCMTSLTELYLNDNSITDVSPLANLTSLTKLRLGENSITDVSPLANLTSLTELRLEDNSITDVSPLQGLTGLEELHVGENDITDFGPLRILEAAGVVFDIEIPDEGNAPSIQPLPKHTVLLSNFPNPFNPETWIPYHLEKSSEVTITIYDIRGRVVRTLLLGLQPAGIYRSRSKAANWDGRNHFGEKVATGLYFYTLKAGDYTATRKMLIMK